MPTSQSRWCCARAVLCGLRRARGGGIDAACKNQAHAEVATGSLGGEPLDASDEALAYQFEHEAVGCSEYQRVGPGTGFRRKRPDPGIEEHTSELQSRLHLVCRLLLEKKKKTT